MEDQQQIYDDAMFDFSRADYDTAIEKLNQALHADPKHFDAQLALGMAYSRKGDFQRAIEEGHKAEQLRPGDQWAHTNLSLFYVKIGDKEKAEHHGLQARLASWKGNMAAPDPNQTDDSELKMSKPQPPPVKPPAEFPEMPWKKKKKIGGGESTS